MKKIILLSLITLFVFDVNSQRRRNNQSANTQQKENKLSLSALKLRNVGPAFLSGRIADIAIHPENNNVWYVATGSSGVWTVSYTHLRAHET